MGLNLLSKTPPPRQIYVLATVYSEQYQLDEVQWGPRNHFLLFKSRPGVYYAYFKVPHDFNA